METRANFLLIGLFMAANVALAFRFILFIESGWTADSILYELAFSNVDASISPGVPINFNGVKVGEIVNAPFSKDPALAVMLAQIDRQAPIRANTKAKVELLNLMGSVMISLEGVAGDSSDLKPLPGQRYPRIIVENKLSPLLKFDELSARFAKVSEKAKATLGGIPSELSTIKWQLESVIDAIQPLMKAQESGPITFNIESLQRSTVKLESMIDSSQRFVKANSLAEIERRSQETRTSSVNDLLKLKNLAIDLRKKSNIFEQKIHDMGLTQTDPR
jgi:hypothetical protein